MPFLADLVPKDLSDPHRRLIALLVTYDRFSGFCCQRMKPPDPFRGPGNWEGQEQGQWCLSQGVAQWWGFHQGGHR